MIVGTLMMMGAMVTIMVSWFCWNSKRGPAWLAGVPWN